MSPEGTGTTHDALGTQAGQYQACRGVRGGQGREGGRSAVAEDLEEKSESDVASSSFYSRLTHITILTLHKYTHSINTHIP